MKQEMTTDIRCRHCDKLLARIQAFEGTIEHKCPRCGAYAILRATRPNAERQERPREVSCVESRQPIQRGRTV